MMMRRNEEEEENDDEDEEEEENEDDDKLKSQWFSQIPGCRRTNYSSWRSNCQSGSNSRPK